jgi:hypothetical protein
MLRRLRAGFIERLTGIDTVGEIPGGIDDEIRDSVADLLRDPSRYALRAPGCGGTRPGQPGKFEQRTRVARLVRGSR